VETAFNYTYAVGYEIGGYGIIETIGGRYFSKNRFLKVFCSDTRLGKALRVCCVPFVIQAYPEAYISLLNDFPTGKEFKLIKGLWDYQFRNGFLKRQLAHHFHPIYARFGEQIWRTSPDISMCIHNILGYY